jgi:hypothetical protein
MAPTAELVAGDSDMADTGQQIAERPIQQAPQWLLDRMTPTAQLTAAREEALRGLDGDPTARVQPLDGVDALFDADDRGAA